MRGARPYHIGVYVAKSKKDSFLVYLILIMPDLSGLMELAILTANAWGVIRTGCDEQKNVERFDIEPRACNKIQIYNVLYH